MRGEKIAILASFLILLGQPAQARLQSGEVHVWEMQEITLAAAQDYPNPYVDVECWVELAGPGFSGRVYGFWDGGRAFKVRLVATQPGEWSWRVGSNHPNDAGLQGAGGFRAVAWNAAELAANPNRRGFVRASEKNSHNDISLSQKNRREIVFSRHGSARYTQVEILRFFWNTKKFH